MPAFPAIVRNCSWEVQLRRTNHESASTHVHVPQVPSGKIEFDLKEHHITYTIVLLLSKKN